MIFFKKKQSELPESKGISPHIRLGAIGEEAACKHLRKQKLKIATRNFKAKHGEIDIIAEDRKTLIFAEVKTRTAEPGESLRRPSDAVNSTKRENIIKTANEFIHLYCKNDRRQIRFDVIEVYADRECNIKEIIHIKNAFSAY